MSANLVRLIAERQGLMESDGQIWRDRCEFIALVMEDCQAVLLELAAGGPEDIWSTDKADQ